MEETSIMAQEQGKPIMLAKDVMHEDFSSSVISLEESCAISEEGDVAYDDQEAAKEESDDELERLVRHEARHVWMWRFIVVAAMITTASSLVAATYVFLSRDETEVFAVSFKEISVSLFESVSHSAISIKQALLAFSDDVTSAALTSTSTWPFVTMPHFDIHGRNVRSQSGVASIILAPRVSVELLEEWANYSASQSGTSSRLAVSSGGLGQVQSYDPVWQMDPISVKYTAGIDLASIKSISASVTAMYRYEETILGMVLYGDAASQLVPDDNMYDEPYSFYIQPVYDSFANDTRKLVATAVAAFRWEMLFRSRRPNHDGPIFLVLDNTCGQSLTWKLTGKNVAFQGMGDSHDPAYDSFKESSTIFESSNSGGAQAQEGACGYSLSAYPTNEMQNEYETNRPILITVFVAITCTIVGLLFVRYDAVQQKRNRTVLARAAKTNELVNSLFPANIRQRLFELKNPANVLDRKRKAIFSNKGQLKHFLDGQEMFLTSDVSKPIADLFTDTTIMFMDICGFTAWSSVREPCQVFTLLETLYGAIDEMAKKRRVFKVETVGDCYVAVAGLPEPRKDHALVMARFAYACLRTVHSLMQRLEVTLGPDTGDLSVRIGLHSGPVTAGVLRGERSRFQLFGDTMNTASRMESTGVKGRIQVSKETAELLEEGGKAHWLSPRGELVSAKGKGLIQTFWLDVKSSTAGSVTAFYDDEGQEEEDHSRHSGKWADMVALDRGRGESSERKERLIQWHVDVFSRFLKQIVARRQTGKSLLGLTKRSLSVSDQLHNLSSPRSSNSLPTLCEASCDMDLSHTPLDEVKEIISLPKFDTRISRMQENLDKIVLDDKVISQLHHYISTIANMYHDNAFHNFAHASHVAMSVTKLLSRIVMPQDLDCFDSSERNDLSSSRNVASSLHDHTYGITSDPLTQFSVVLAALIHDVDHMGVPNTQLIKENATLAALYKNKSVAEQNSVDLGWKLLMMGDYQDLRNTIYQSNEELARFRQLMVQSVLATDITDKELKALRNARWDRAFKEKRPVETEKPRDMINRKATIVIEHLLQASDVAHTMQHWEVYRQWNERFFRECYRAYKDGRAEKDPSIDWYEGEKGFFDFYIIPLAKKLKECGVFGVSSDEYLSYAMMNRKEWEERGQEVVAEMVEAVHRDEAKDEIHREILGISQHSSQIQKETNNKLLESLLTPTNMELLRQAVETSEEEDNYESDSFEDDEEDDMDDVGLSIE